MKFHLQRREVEGIGIIDLNGHLVIGPALQVFNETVSECIAGGKASLVLNLGSVSVVDSSGLGALISAQTSARGAGGAIKLLHVSERHIQLLVLTRLSTEFEMFNDEQAAVDSFFPDRKRTSFDILEFVQTHADDQQRIGADEPTDTTPGER
jgi:anti-sigma B factor antagonist